MRRCDVDMSSPFETLRFWGEKREPDRVCEPNPTASLDSLCRVLNNFIHFGRKPAAGGAITMRKWDADRADACRFQACAAISQQRRLDVRLSREGRGRLDDHDHEWAKFADKEIRNASRGRAGLHRTRLRRRAARQSLSADDREGSAVDARHGMGVRLPL